MNPDIGLTDEDLAKLRDMAQNGVQPYTRPGGGDGPTAELDGVPMTCRYCGYEWRYRGTGKRATCSQCKLPTPLPAPDGRGLTEPMCNAIREAAADDLTYREIADLFSFIVDGTAAWKHATGRCSHGNGDLPPVEPAREPGPVDGVSESECRQLRRRCAAGRTQTDIADEFDRARSTVHRHVNGDCSHWLHGR